VSIDVTFIVDGVPQQVTLAAGERLLKGAYKLGLDERGFGECGGNCVCSTCHVFVQEGAELFKAPSAEEEDMLDTVFNCQSNSRLACQLIAVEGMPKVVVEVPATQE